MKRKSLIVYLLLFIMAVLGAAGCDCQQKSSSDREKTKVSGDLGSWTDDSKTKEKIVEYVTQIIDDSSKNFIPEEDRIAVFDMDGTIIPEEPYNIQFQFLVYYIRNDLKKDKSLNKLLERLLDDMGQTTRPDETSELYSQIISEVLPGMSQEDYVDGMKRLMKSERDDFENLTYEESMYQPIVELIDYLKKNDFQVYVVSGADRGCVWGCVEDKLQLERSHLIGADITLSPSGMQDMDSSYIWQDSDELVRGEQYFSSDTYNNKVYNIYRQIGKKPVLAVGNTDVDFSMLNYAKSNSYKSLSILLYHDDEEREYAYNEYSSWLQIADENGWTVTSMKNEFKNMFAKDTVKIGK